VHMGLHRRLPLITTIPRAFREAQLERTWNSGYPTWINPDFVERMKLAERWADEEESPLRHPFRPVGYNSLLRARWQAYFEEFDSSGTGAAVEFRHPYFDIRVLRFLLAIPALPWCRRKYLVRRAMRGILPDAILRRDKTPLYPDPWTALAQKIGFPRMDAAPGLSEYVDGSKVFVGAPSTLADFRDAIRPRSLNYWLKSTSDFRHN
jgi:asparagine synthase (glutamine-hydrolysing)